MSEGFQAVRNTQKRGEPYPVKRFGPENAGKVRRFHASFPGYQATPLVNLEGLARELGLGGVCVKDESRRFGLNAFKVLGGSYAMGSYIARRLGMQIEELSYEAMTGEEVRRRLGEVTFVTATDGNHGRGVAWTANRLGQKAVVYMPKGSAPERLRNIQALGAEASITDLNYDDAVRLAQENAARYGWVLVQDTAWEGYEDIPGWIMKGYTTMALEAAEQMQAGGFRPTHIFLQAGVGSMAGAVAGFFADLYGKGERPVITVVEPDQADCLFRTAQAGDGRLHFVSGRMDTIMAGLACGEPCTLGWEVLRDHADHFVSCPDYVAAQGMRILSSPLPGDERVISGESGAATLGFVAEVMRNEKLAWLRRQLCLDKDSRVLCISTEGATDRENYQKIVWDGAWPRP